MKPSTYPSRGYLEDFLSKEKNQTIAQNKKTDDAPF